MINLSETINMSIDENYHTASSFLSCLFLYAKL